MSVAVYVFYPETKGRSLEEMDIVFSGSVWAFKDIRNGETHQEKVVEEFDDVKEQV
jgi:hypothetical protein